MRYFILLSILCISLFSRENPFDSPFDRPKVEQENIPLLNIKTHKVFSSPKILDIDKKITLKKQPTKNIPIVLPEKKVEKKAEKKFLLPPIIIDDNKPSCISICEVSKPILKKRKKKKRNLKHYRKKSKYKTIFNNYFLTVMTDNSHIKIYTKDSIICTKTYKNPKRVMYDFKRLQYFNTKNIKIKSDKFNMIKFGSHHNFYRITINLNHKSNIKYKKTTYGYLIY